MQPPSPVIVSGYFSNITRCHRFTFPLVANLYTFGMEICLLRKYKLGDPVNQRVACLEGELNRLWCSA